MKKGHYFARFGKVFGPFTADEVEEMQASGKVREFTWIWDLSSSAWKAMDPAPAPLFFETEASALRPQSDHALAAPVPTGLNLRPEALEVLAHNRESFVQGSVRFMTQTGCELETLDAASSPLFADNGHLVLNILDEDTGKVVNLRAKVCGVARSSRGWSYQIRWEAPPSFTR